MKLLALRQPMAVDLRETLAAHQDRQRTRTHRRSCQKHRQARHCAQSRTADPPDAEPRPHGPSALSQLKHVLDAYSDRDAAGAEAVWRQDDEIDEIYNSLFRELLTYMMEDPRTIGLCTHLLFVAKNIERCGDHATNIAETVYHMVSGDHLATDRPKADVTSETTVPFEHKA